MMKLFKQYNLVFLVLFFLFIPGLLALVKVVFPHVLSEQLNPVYHLAGYPDLPQKKEVTFSNLESHDFQKYADTGLTNRLPFRSLLIRFNNQIYYSLFHKSYTGLVIGNSGWVLGDDYIRGYCNDFSKDKMNDWANKIKQLSDFFESRGQTFIYLITPSKPEYMPSVIPERFHCQNQETIVPHEAYLANLLQQKHVRVVNEVEDMIKATHEYGTLMFSKGGNHWNELGSMIGANSVLNAINKTNNIHIDPIKFTYEKTQKPRGRDTDVLDLLNILKPNRHYDVTAVSYLSTKNKSPKYSAVFIGGSFIDGMGDAFGTLNTFSSMLTYNYFNSAIYDYTGGGFVVIPRPDIHTDLMTAPILNANVVVLEENASRTNSTHGNLFYSVIMDYAKKNRAHLSFHPERELRLVNRIEESSRKKISQQLIEGVWYSDGKPTKIIFNGNKITIKNELNAVSGGSIENHQLLDANDWQIKAALSLDGKKLQWNNGSVWTR